MTYILDTHVWLWFVAQPERIRSDLLEEFQDARTRLVLSAVSSWEIAIKWSAGRLSLPEPPLTYVPSRMLRANVSGLGVEHEHTLHVAELPRHHGDPFDRLLIAQAQVEGIPIVTVDPEFDRYDVEVVRAA